MFQRLKWPIAPLHATSLDALSANEPSSNVVETLEELRIIADTSARVVGPGSTNTNGNEREPSSSTGSRFQSIPELRLGKATVATILSCLLWAVAVGIPFAVNEKHIHSVILRGVITGVFACFTLPLTLVIMPMTACGKFNKRFLISIPILFGIGFASASIPVGSGSRFGILSSMIFSVYISYILCMIFLSGPSFYSAEHKSLDKALGPPQAVCNIVF